MTVTTERRLSRLAAADLDTMLLIRHFELGLLDLFEQGKLNGTTHTCLGQEYIPVALGPLLVDGDHVFSNHRGHGHYLSRFGDAHGLLAEIMGRQGAVCNGVGGSQHILRGTYLSTGVQGQSLPVAAGVALHLRRGGDPLLAAAYIGDGTWGEGAVYEALNLARLWSLPLLVVVEHNRIAQSTRTEDQMAGTIAGRAQAFGIRHQRIAGADVNAIRELLTPLVEEVRHRREPAVVEFDTYRVGPHSKGDDSRDRPLIEEAARHDWYRLYAEDHPEQFAPADRRQRDRVAQIIHEVAARPASAWESPCA
ncbi:thiamine pyrophosphate-dependent dehydrogenase E1 component subunit alpha [Streptosporangium sp. KLBMP 9127]|nr:thiamine pyrophosphate-dependent dehydrogenase E1 component subunit alpha [Streptosporangium sp. KLBMP 9127]